VKQVFCASVASLLTFASVAVLPAFALETGGVQRWHDVQVQRDKSVSVTKSYNFKKSEDFARHGGEREQYAKGTRRGHDGDRFVGYGKNEHRGEREPYHWGDRKKDSHGEREHEHSRYQDRGHKGDRYYASR
jgi:hypothetical protein